MGKTKVDPFLIGDLYLFGIRSGELSKHFHVSKNTINKITNKLGITDYSRCPKEKIKAVILAKHYQRGLGLYRLSKKFNMSQSVIRRKLKKLGVLDSNKISKKKEGSRRSRRTSQHEFKDSVKKKKFFSKRGKCDICHRVIGNGVNWREATYHHKKLVSNGGSGSIKNCMVLHFECHKKHFFRLHGFNYLQLNNYKKIPRKIKPVIDETILLNLYVNPKLKEKDIAREMHIGYWPLKRIISTLIKKGTITKHVLKKRQQINSSFLKIKDEEFISRMNMHPRRRIAEELKISEREVYFRLRKIRMDLGLPL